MLFFFYGVLTLNSKGETLVPLTFIYSFFFKNRSKMQAWWHRPEILLTRKTETEKSTIQGWPTFQSVFKAAYATF